VRFSFEGHT